MIDERRPLDARAAAAMVLLCAFWGFQQIAVKLTVIDVPLMTQAALRSIFAALCLLLWALARRIPLFGRDGTLWPGILAGVAFAGEFAFIYAGLWHTSAARMIVFLYLGPCLTALGLSLFVPGERLRAAQWVGVAIAFAGITVAFSDGFSASTRSMLIGDAMGVLAAAFWAATTVLIRATGLTRISATKVLFYQLAVSAVLLALLAFVMDAGLPIRWTPLAVLSIAFQSAVVAFASYLVWFWLLTKYLAGRLAVFAFLTPLYGVAFGWTILNDPVSPALLGATALVGAGIALVNLPPGALSARRPVR